MKKIFINQEVKISTFILTLLLTLFMVIQICMYNDYIKTQKQDYIDIIGSIASKSISTNKELEKEIIPLVTGNISKEDKQNGRKLLKQYGITSSLNDDLFPNINNNFSIINLIDFIKVVYQIKKIL